jgi:DNA polymerase IV
MSVAPPTAVRPQRAIVHADLDAFFASVEQRDEPSLRGRAVLVGGRPEGRGVVAAASYEARASGARSAMPMRTAIRLCPQAVVVAPRFDAYAAASSLVMEVFHRRSELVEPLSLDEAYLDLGHDELFWSQAEQRARALKDDVFAATGLRLSVGVATSKSVAKIASDLRKPDGLVVVPPGDEAAFLAPLPVGRLSGVGPRSQERLARLAIATIGDLARADPAVLRSLFGRWGDEMSQLARGVDHHPVVSDRERKSVGRETTFADDIAPGGHLDQTLDELCGQVAERLSRRSLRGRTVTVKVRYADFTTHTRQTTLPVALTTREEILRVATRLIEDEVGGEARLRLIGVTVSGFADEAQLPLFTVW